MNHLVKEIKGGWLSSITHKGLKVEG
jgi:hypothetical protein